MLMKILKYFFLSLILLITLSCSEKSKGYNIQVQVEGIKSAEANLGYHFTGRQFVFETVKIDENGRFKFKGSEKLPGGLYIITLPDDKYLEIIIDKDQIFSVKADIADLLGKTGFEGSSENRAFYEYLVFWSEKQKKSSFLRKELENPSVTRERKQEVSSELNSIKKQIKDKQDNHINNFPDGVLTLIFKTQRELDFPNVPRLEDGSEDYDSAYRQYRDEFWKNIDLTDERLLRTPVYHVKLFNYFTNVVKPDPDTIIMEAERIIDYTRGSEEMFKNTVFLLAGIFDRAPVKGFDSAFVHIVEKYYEPEEVSIEDDNILKSIIRRAERLKPILIGSTAPDIEMYMDDNSTIALHEVPADYTVLYFWDSECIHCSKVTFELNELYEKEKNADLLIFAVNTDEDTENFKKQIEKKNIGEWLNVSDPENRSGFREKYNIRSVPLLFLLDRDKKIIEKNIKVSQIEQILKSRKQLF